MPDILVIGGPGYKGKDKKPDTSGDDEKADMEKEEGEGGGLKTKAVETLFKAMKAGDSKAGSLALESFLEACGYTKPEGETE